MEIILSSVITVLFIVTWFSIRRWVKHTDFKIDKLIEKIGTLAEAMTSHKERLASMSRRIGVNEKRLSDHARRIRKVETTDAVQNEKIKRKQ